MPLSEDEQRILQQIEQQFYASDPDLAGEIGNHSLYAHCMRQLRWAGVAFLGGVVLLSGALYFGKGFVVAFVGFVIMLGAALWGERSLRKMGRAGIEQLSETFRRGALGGYLGDGTDRMRDRFRRDDAEPDADADADDR